MKDCYQILGISRDGVYSDDKNEAQRNAYIEQAYKDRKKILKAAMEYPKLMQEKLEKMKEKVNLYEKAYETIRTEELRILYEEKRKEDMIREAEEKKDQLSEKSNSNKKVGFHELKGKYSEVQQRIRKAEQERNAQKRKYNEFKKQYEHRMPKSAYSILGVLEETIERYSEEEQDEAIKQHYNNRIEKFKQELKECKDFTQRNKLIIKMNDIKKAYEQINSSENRREYKKVIAKDKIQREGRKKQVIKSKYSHMSEYNLELIRNRRKDEGESIQNKITKKVQDLSRVFGYDDEENRNLRLRRTGMIGFLNITSNELQKVYEYEVKRTVNKEEKIDTICTGISMVELHTMGREANPDYYDCIVNKLLSEELIEGSKYNGGYIGEVEVDENGQYTTTLKKDKLSPKEQEMLTAVIIEKQKERARGEER